MLRLWLWLALGMAAGITFVEFFFLVPRSGTAMHGCFGGFFFDSKNPEARWRRWSEVKRLGLVWPAEDKARHTKMFQMPRRSYQLK